ncbi:hypothetical protein [Streptomyces sp. TRM64462]|uniref:hypothetical protein n=1 Tax=Streptomyces sp. TRM64462 TaxID=2741726 RepID=UPI001586ABFD|nr:hypothetical protein [Streptomyces sp. TRM64462]
MTTESRTGTRDDTYDLVSLLYHTLQEGETLTTYIDDTRRAGDEELAAFLEQVQEQDRERARKAKSLLADRLTAGAAA